MKMETFVFKIAKIVVELKTCLFFRVVRFFFNNRNKHLLLFPLICKNFTQIDKYLVSIKIKSDNIFFDY